MPKAIRRTVEFDAIVEEGAGVTIPLEMLHQLGSVVGKKVRVRLALESDVLSRNGVSEGELEKIRHIQMESEDQVMKFLSSEGVLKRGRRQMGRRRQVR